MPKKKKIVVHYEKEKFEFEEEQVPGSVLYETFNVPSGYKLFLEVKKQDGEDEFIRNDPTLIQLKNGGHFYDLPPGTVG